jgi:hypothetical protein
MPFPVSQDVINWFASFSSVEGSRLLWDGRSGNRIPVWVRISVSVQPGPWIHPAYYTTDCVSLTTHPDLSPKLKKEYAVRLFPSGPSWPVLSELRFLRKLITCTNVVMWECCVLISTLLDVTQFTAPHHYLFCILYVWIHFSVLNLHWNSYSIFLWVFEK